MALAINNKTINAIEEATIKAPTYRPRKNYSHYLVFLPTMKILNVITVLSLTYTQATIIPDLIANTTAIGNLFDIQSLTTQFSNDLTEVIRSLINGNVTKAISGLQEVVETTAFVIEEAAVKSLKLPLGTGLPIVSHQKICNTYVTFNFHFLRMSLLRLTVIL